VQSPDKVINVARSETARAGQKARIHSGADGGKQPVPAIAGSGRALRRRSRGKRMGRYIDNILQPGEKVLYSTNAHWVFFLPAIAVWIVALVLLVMSRMTTVDSLVLACLASSVVVAIAALFMTAKAWFHRWTTETDVTNMRVVHKTGFIRRRTFEMSLDKVESVDVNQSILGRLLDYGSVTVRGVGEGVETIDSIAAPLDFRSHITAR
jgi:membrane protein YdbS with pleckstrin-like domain